MRIYFAAPRSGLKQFEKNYRLITATIKGLGFEVTNNWIVAKLEGKDLYKSPEDMVQKETRLLAQSDFIVAEISTPSFAIGYIIRQALLQRKLVLCLFLDDLDKSLAAEVFLGNSSNLLKVEYYNQKNLVNILSLHLDTTQLNGLIKFNFLISPGINSYLDWATEAKKQSKSEFLREAIIKKIIDQDKDYQSFFKKPKKS